MHAAVQPTGVLKHQSRDTAKSLLGCSDAPVQLSSQHLADTACSNAEQQLAEAALLYAVGCVLDVHICGSFAAADKVCVCSFSALNIV
jgi:hypothetical protein